MSAPTPDDAVAVLLQALRADQGRAIPTSAAGRLFRNARAAASVGLSALGGRLRGRGAGGLDGVGPATLARLVTRLGELKGLAMKAGQMMGYIDATLPPELRQLLSLLQTQSQPATLEAVHAALCEDLGERAGSLIDALEPTPASVASIGQVHRARLPSGEAVAVKVRHADVDQALAADFKAAGLGPLFARLFMPGAVENMRDHMREMEAALLEECDYAQEAEHQRRFGAWYADHPLIRVPAVHDAWCGPRVLTTAWAPGASLDAWLARDPRQEARDRLGVALFDFYFGTLYRQAWFHADPHPGNYAIQGDGDRIDGLVIYDYGCVRAFDRESIMHLAALAHAVRDDDDAATRQALEDLGARPPTDTAGRDHVRALLRGFFAPLLHEAPRPVDPGGALEAGQVFRDKRRMMKLALPGKLLFLFRIRFGLYAVLARLGAVADWRALESELSEGAGVIEGG
jgi:predicted unusual protein kinase regulating ubiquinone biosynthesis (AarF/ABC1/UbiB family)